jgi:hypothetical protein
VTRAVNRRVTQLVHQRSGRLDDPLDRMESLQSGEQPKCLTRGECQTVWSQIDETWPETKCLRPICIECIVRSEIEMRQRSECRSTMTQPLGEWDMIVEVTMPQRRHRHGAD